jgi:hypothetical protein
VRLLLLYCRSFAYTLHHATPVAEEPNRENGRFDDVLVAFVACEPDDEAVVEQAAREISARAERLGAAGIVVNPFVHLTSSPAGAQEARRISEAMVQALVAVNERPIEYTAFGWYKSFQVDVHGVDGGQVFREWTAKRRGANE